MKHKGEALIGVIVISFIAGLYFAVIAPSAYYDKNKAEECPEYREDTNKEQREYCYLKKDADEAGYEIIKKQSESP